MMERVERLVKRTPRPLAWAIAGFNILFNVLLLWLGQMLVQLEGAKVFGWTLTAIAGMTLLFWMWLGWSNTIADIASRPQPRRRLSTTDRNLFVAIFGLLIGGALLTLGPVFIVSAIEKTGLYRVVGWDIWTMEEIFTPIIQVGLTLLVMTMIPCTWLSIRAWRKRRKKS